MNLKQLNSVLFYLFQKLKYLEDVEDEVKKENIRE